MTECKPIPSNYMFDALKDEDTIIMACNTRTPTGLIRGIFRAAKDLDAVVMMELAKSEADLTGGYTGMTPGAYSKFTCEAAKEIGFDVWSLHADHTTVKKGTDDEIAATKELISAQVKAGYTSFAIDCSFLFNEDEETVEGQLARNIEVTTDLVKHLKMELGDREYGLEVEVGEIGKKDEHGRILTTPEEAVTFIKKLKGNGVEANGIAIANGSAHGNAYDADGNLVPQLGIDIPQTIKVADALGDAGFNARIVQHGVTGTPLEFITTKFPKKAIIKGNVGTNWQNIVWDVLSVYEPELWQEIKDWVKGKYGEAAREKGMKTEEMLLGKYSKNAFKPFYDKLISLDKGTVKAIEDNVYANALLFFEAFGAVGSAEKVREAMK